MRRTVWSVQARGRTFSWPTVRLRSYFRSDRVSGEDTKTLTVLAIVHQIVQQCSKEVKSRRGLASVGKASWWSRSVRGISRSLRPGALKLYKDDKSALLQRGKLRGKVELVDEYVVRMWSMVKQVRPRRQSHVYYATGLLPPPCSDTVTRSVAFALSASPPPSSAPTPYKGSVYDERSASTRTSRNTRSCFTRGASQRTAGPTTFVCVGERTHSLPFVFAFRSPSIH